MTALASADADVVVIGAGVSGLAVADGLLRAGRSVQVFEARSTAGGRIRSVVVPGGSADLGPTWFWPGEHRVAQLAQELDLSIHQQWLAGDALFAADGGTRRIAGPVMSPAYRFTDGAISLIDGLMQHIPDGIVTLGTPVLRLEQSADSVTIYLANRTVTAAAVVVAVPPSLAMQSGMIAPADIAPQVAQVASTVPVWMGGVTKAVAVYSEPFWRELGLSGTAISQQQTFSEIHDMSGPEGTPAMLFGFSHRSPADPGETFIVELAAAFGPKALSPVSTFVADWSSEPFTSPVGPQSVPRYELYGSPHLQTPSWDGRLHWASTETADVAPGHIEGALAAAERTVRDLLAR